MSTALVFQALQGCLTWPTNQPKWPLPNLCLKCHLKRHLNRQPKSTLAPDLQPLSQAPSQIRPSAASVFNQPSRHCSHFSTIVLTSHCIHLITMVLNLLLNHSPKPATVATSQPLLQINCSRLNCCLKSTCIKRRLNCRLKSTPNKSCQVLPQSSPVARYGTSPAATPPFGCQSNYPSKIQANIDNTFVLVVWQVWLSWLLKFSGLKKKTKFFLCHIQHQPPNLVYHPSIFAASYPAESMYNSIQLNDQRND